MSAFLHACLLAAATLNLFSLCLTGGVAFEDWDACHLIILSLHLQILELKSRDIEGALMKLVSLLNLLRCSTPSCKQQCCAHVEPINT